MTKSKKINKQKYEGHGNRV